MGLKRLVADQMRERVWGGMFGLPEDHPAKASFMPAAYYPIDISSGSHASADLPGTFVKNGLTVTKEIPGDPSARHRKRQDWGRAVVIIANSQSFEKEAANHPRAEPIVFASARTPRGLRLLGELGMLGGLGEDARFGFVELDAEQHTAHAMRLGVHAARFGFGIRLPEGIATPPPDSEAPYITHIVDVAQIGQPGPYEYVKLS